MVRLFNVYYPVRTLVLLAGETLVVCGSFLLATLIQFQQDSFIVLNYEGGYYKILGVTVLALLCLYSFDLYDPQRMHSRAEVYVRLLIVVGALSLILAVVGYLFPRILMGGGTFLIGLTLLTAALMVWRALYAWMVQWPFLRERVYVLGAGQRANRLVEALRTRPDLGMEVVGWTGALGDGSLTREELGRTLESFRRGGRVDRVIVALSDRRGTLPVRELLDLRLRGVKIEEATDLLERTSGTIDVDALHPSWLIFSEGFRLNPTVLLVRRIVSTLVSLTALLVFLPIIPLIALAIKLTSPGPVIYRQRRVGRRGVVFECYKFRTMREDAEADGAPQWATEEDPRVTTVGRWLRKARLDEIPQLWNVLKGDMGFVGPRPERPEFVESLLREIPFYHLRHLVRPGLTGWAQVNYPYGASIEESKEKLKYDLYYIKHISLSLDLLIMFHSVKIVVFSRGAR